MKNALFLTGAAARISQEVAIIDKLIEKNGLVIDAETTMLAGFSSGALNIGAINSCFRKEHPLSWDDYFKNEILFNIKTVDIYTRQKFIPVNTKPLRQLLKNFLNNASIERIDDCTFDSYILAFSFRRLTTIWLSNVYNRNQSIDFTDLLMATSAIPFIFPDQTISNLDKRKAKFTRGRYVDGGTGGSFKRFEKHLKKYVRQHGQLGNIYIISPMREISSEDFSEMNKLVPSTDLFKLDIKDFKILKVFLDMISQNGFDTFIKKFHRWIKKNNIAENIYVCIPQLENNFPLLNFDRQKSQYLAVCKWADENPDRLAIPIEEYVKKFDHLPIKKITQKIEITLKQRFLNFFNKN